MDVQLSLCWNMHKYMKTHDWLRMQIHAFLTTAMDSVRRRKPRRPLHTRTWLQKRALPFLFQESNSNSSIVQTVYLSLKNKRAILAPVKDRYLKKRMMQRTRNNNNNNNNNYYYYYNNNYYYYFRWLQRGRDGLKCGFKAFNYVVAQISQRDKSSNVNSTHFIVYEVYLTATKGLNLYS